MRFGFQFVHNSVLICNKILKPVPSAIPQKANTMKQVVYFLGEYAGQEVAYQQEELSGAYLVSYEEAMGMFQFESSRRVLKEANAFLLGNL